MGGPASDFRELVRRQAWEEAARAFLTQAADADLRVIADAGGDLEAAHLLLDRVLPALCRKSPDWLLREPQFLPACLGLARSAHACGYQPAQMDRLILQLHCLKAVDELLHGRVAEAGRAILSAQSSADAMAFPQNLTNGVLNGLLSLRTMTVATIEEFFGSYVEKLRGIGQGDLADRVASAVEPIVHNLRRVEQKPGVVRGLFVDDQGRGTIQNVVVTIEEGPEGIVYSSLEGDSLAFDMEDVAERSRKAAHEQLRRMGYPEGLSERRVVWQIADMVGRTKKAADLYEGHSVGLALAVGILSCYVNRPVPPDVTMTGSFDVLGADEGEVTGVRGIREKLRAVREARCERVFLSKENTHDVKEAETAEKGSFPVTFVGQLAEVCAALFPPETQDSVKAIVSRCVPALYDLFVGKGWWDSISPHHGHKKHLWTSSLVFTCLCLLEGWTVWMVFGRADMSARQGAAAVLLGVVAILTSHLLALGLAVACVEARRRIGWLVSIVGSLLGFGVFGLVLCLIVEKPSERLLQGVAEWPPRLNVIKDTMMIWCFAVIYLHAFFNHVLGLEFLVRRRQLSTVRRLLSGRSLFEGALPVQVVTIPWWPMTVITVVVAMYLVATEMYAFIHVIPGSVPGERMMVFGVARELVFMVAVGQALGWYRWALSLIGAEAGKLP